MLSESHHGPHFVETHDRHAEEVDGEIAYRLPLQEFIDYLDSHPDDPMAIEAVALVTNNHGLVFLHHNYTLGERNLSMLFLKKPEASEHLVPVHPARILGRQFDFPGKSGSWPEIEAHLIALLDIIGIKPNLHRIRAEFCPNCGK